MEKRAKQPPETEVEERREEQGRESGQPVDRRAFLQSAVAASVGAGVLGAALLAEPEAAEAANTIGDTASAAKALATALNTPTLVSSPADLSPALVDLLSRLLTQKGVVVHNILWNGQPTPEVLTGTVSIPLAQLGDLLGPLIGQGFRGDAFPLGIPKPDQVLINFTSNPVIEG